MLFVEKDRHHANHMKQAVIFCEDHPCSGEENMYQRPVMAKRNQGNKPETLKRSLTRPRLAIRNWSRSTKTHNHGF
jgi:hypothetical protein